MLYISTSVSNRNLSHSIKKYPESIPHPHSDEFFLKKSYFLMFSEIRREVLKQTSK